MKRVTNFLGAIVIVLILTLLDREIGKEQEPVNQKKRSFVWAWGCLLALFALGFMNKCINAQEAQVFRAPLIEGTIGQTVCNDNNVVAIIISSLYDLDSVQYDRAVSHERVHEQQIKEAGSCAKALELYHKDRLAKEIPAFCKELKQRMLMGNSIEVLTQFILYLQNRYTPTLTIDEIEDKVNEFCLGGQNAPP